MINRSVYCEDAITWLEAKDVQMGCSFVTSMPDISEFPGYSLNDWKTWFTQTAKLVLSRCAFDGVTIFYQSDIKVNGTWVDKATSANKQLNHSGELLWHKIICRSPAELRLSEDPPIHYAVFLKRFKVIFLNLLPRFP